MEPAHFLEESDTESGTEGGTERAEWDAAVKRILDYFSATFLAEKGVRPRIVRGKDPRLVKDMLASWDEETVREIVRRFCSSTDPRIINGRMEIGNLFAEAQYLLLADQRFDNRRTARNYHAAAQAMKKEPRNV